GGDGAGRVRRARLQPARWRAPDPATAGRPRDQRPPATRLGEAHIMRRQRGAALLAAMLTVTLVATFAAAALWQQWRSVEVEGADRQRVQSTWILTGAQDWARLILREDRDAAAYLSDPWAVPLDEARLSTFLAADQGNNAMTETSDADQVFLSGDITDLQSRLNVNSLVQAGVLQQQWLNAFQRLFALLGLPDAQLQTMAANLRFALEIG